MIIGRDLLKALSMQLDFEKGVTVWDGISVPMRDFRDEGKSNEYNLIYTDIPESEAVNSLNERTNRILDAKYEKANIEEYVQECTDLDDLQKHLLKELLYKYEPLFDGTLGKWKMKPVSLRLKPNSKLGSSRPFLVSHYHLETLKK